MYQSLKLPLFSLSALGACALTAAEFTWDGEPASAGAQYGPATATWDTSTIHWIPGNSDTTTASGIATAVWTNSASDTANFKSLTSGTVPASLTLTLGGQITAGKIDVGGSFNTPITITDGGDTSRTLSVGTLAPNGSTETRILTIDAVINTAGNLSKINGGQAVLNKANTYTGTTNVSAGILTAKNAASFSTGQVNVSGSGQVIVDGVTISNALSLNGGWSDNTQYTGSLRMLNNATVSGPVAVGASGGSVNATLNTGTISGPITLNGNLSTIRGTIHLTGAISGNGGLIINPNGHTSNANLSGTAANTFSGDTVMHANVLNLNKTGVNAIGGNMIVNGGTVNWLQANQVADTASITVSGGNINTANRADTIANLTINSAAVSTFSGMTITDTLTVTNGIQDAVNSGGTLTTNRAVLSGNSNSRLGANSGASTWNIGSGGLEMNTATIQFGNQGGSDTTVNLQGDLTATGTNQFTQGTNTAGVRSINLNGARTFAINSGETSVASRIGLTNGSLVKNGAGLLNLNSASSYAGGTTINEGTLLANNTAPEASGSATGAGALLINTAGTLGGSGTVAGAVTSNGVISPGSNSAASLFGLGTLTLGSSLDLNAGSELQLQFQDASGNVASGLASDLTSNPGQGAAQDFLAINGDLFLDPTATITLDLTGYTPENGDVLDLFDFALMSLDGFDPYTNIDIISTATNFRIDASRFQEFGALVMVVPEPGRAALLAAATLALAGRRRQAKRP